jgi:acetyl esterase
MRLGTPVRALAWALDRSPTGDVAALTPDLIERARRPLPGRGVTGLIVGRLARGVQVRDRSVPGHDGSLPVRVYSPAGPWKVPRPLVVHFHGGGWVIGSHLSADWLCSGLAAGLGVVVASVGYRLAPEHRAPVAARDCFAATRHLSAHPGDLGIDSARVAVMGDSAGANLAAVVALLARDSGGPALAAQALIYPGTDATLASPSMQTLADSPVLSLRDIKAFLAHYLGADGDPTDPLVSPLLARTHAGLPPALIQTAEHDPLVDDGARYAAALRAAGVAVRYTRYLGVPHGFMSMPGATRMAGQARAEIADFLAASFALEWPTALS